MADVNQFDQASQILQNVDVSDIVSSLAMGIAEAQEKLDNNSVQQIIRLSQQKIGDKSLVELGFVPAFYAFEYADVSASLNLKMKVNTDINVALSLELDNYRQLGYSKENTDIVEKERSEEYRREYKSSSDVIIKSSSSKKIKVSNESFSLDKTKGCVTMIDSFKRKLRDSSEIDRASHSVINSRAVSANNSSSNFNLLDSSGFVMIAMPETSVDSWGIVKLTDYGTATTINLNTTKTLGFDVGTDFDETSSNAQSAIGANEIFQYDFENSGESLKIYFEWDIEFVDYNYQENGVGADSGTVYGNAQTMTIGSKTVNVLEEKLRFLALILKNDPSARINIIGHTDSSGQYTYNVGLSEKRARDVERILTTQMGVSSSQLSIQFKGEDVADIAEIGSLDTANANAGIKNVKYRKIELELAGAADYIVFIGPDFNKGDATPVPAATDANKFIFLGGGSTTKPTDLSFEYGDTTVSINNASGFSDLSELETETQITDNFNMEVRGKTAYLLHNETQLKFTTMSKESSKIKITEDIDQSDSEENYRSEVEVYDSIDRDYFLQKDSEVTKNPGSIAFNASLDARYSRQFEMSVEGTAAVSARLKAIPAPDKFIAYITEEEITT